MDREDFSKAARAHLIQISEGWAFLPPPLPPNFVITPAVLRAADSARGAISELAGATRTGIEWDESTVMLFRPIAINEAVSSARIEGIHTQVIDLVLKDAAPDAKRPSVSPDAEERVREAQNAAATVQLGFEWISDGRTFGVPLMKDLHSRILQSVRGEERNPGGLRQKQVWLGGEEAAFGEATYVPPPPEHVAPALEQLGKWLAGPSEFGPLVDIALGHYQFEAIHPFEDGNGRLGRALIPLFLISKDVIDRPWLAMSGALESRRDEYLGRLLRVGVAEEWLDWVLFFLDAMQAQATDSLRRVRRAIELRRRYAERLASFPSPVPGRALPHVLSKVFVTVGDVSRTTNTTYPTAKSAIDTMVTTGVLEPWDKLGTRQYWYAKEFLAEVYESGFTAQAL